MEEDKEREERRKKREEERKKQVLREKIAICSGLAAILILLTAGTIRSCGKDEKQETESMEVAFQEVEEPDRVTLVAVGDNLYHMPLVETGQDESGIWNYDSVYANVKEKIQAADLAVVNQETVFVADREEVSGYPAFGTPVEVGDALVNLGFDVVQHASNHTYDKAEQGILDSIQFWKEKHPEITVLGIHESQEDRDQIAVVEKNGIKIAMLNYTYGLNGFSLPSSKPYLVDVWDDEKVKSDIQKAKQISDAVICFLHAGEEYSEEPSADMEAKVNLLLEQGVEVTIGTHPHVLQKYEVKTDSQGHRMLVYYSLGNFVSTQQRPAALLGGIAELTLERSLTDGKVRFTDDYCMTPVVMQYDSDPKAKAVYLLSDYTEELAEKHRVHAYTTEEFSLSRLQEMAAKYTEAADETGTPDTSGTGDEAGASDVPGAVKEAGTPDTSGTTDESDTENKTSQEEI
ncbi:MAG: CapA family protein [Clostridiales bacterium]|nr:CapA family protein [Clostridiales bacterium]